MRTTANRNTIQMIHLPLRSIAILLAMLCIFAPSVDARTVSVEEAMAKAQRFYTNAKDPVLRARGLSAPEFKLAYEAKTSAKTASCFYVLNQTPSQGFIIISADDRLPEVLGYSDSGDFDIDQIPDNMKWWLSEYERQIEQALSSTDADITGSTEHRAGWTPIEPLVKSEWHQGAPYNNLCPTIDGQKTPTGCTATAMAQIMNYHQWPVTGRGSHSYDWNGQTLSMDFSTVTFDWENMQDIYYGSNDSPEAQNAVATLMLACGISTNMRYGLINGGGSGAYPYDVYKALFDYFDYDADYLERDGVELSDWENLIYNELVSQRPVLYTGVSSGSSGMIGHAFVCDGYSTDGLFHINWGWGIGDGYFLLNGLSGFTYYQDIVYGISPIRNMEEYMENAIQNGIRINAENFPDDNFRNCLLEHYYGRDGVLIEAEIKRMELKVSSKNISNLKGIEHFTALTDLWCDYNQLTTLDISKNTALRILWCYGNQLTTLDVSNNKALTGLVCYFNQLTNLDVSKNTALTGLVCDSNPLTTLDVSNNKALSTLSCSYNQLTNLDVSNNTALIELLCFGNQLTTLDASNNTALRNLVCHANQLTALDVSNNKALVSLRCNNNQLTNLDVSKNTALTYLFCDNNQLATLDVSNNTALTELWCGNNLLTTLDVSNNKALSTLSCDNNQLTTLDMSGCKALTQWFFGNNPLAFLNCSRGNFKGETMDNLINDLPQNTTNEIYKFYVYDDSHADEGNVCTKEQVAAVKARGWTPYYYDVTDKIWKEYEGGDEKPAGINNNIKTDIGNAPIYNLNGQRVNQAKNGLYIINGKKVVK